MSTKCQRVLLKIKLFPESLKKLSLLNSHIILHNIVTKTHHSRWYNTAAHVDLCNKSDFYNIKELLQGNGTSENKKKITIVIFPLNNIPELLLGKSQHMKK